MQENVVCLCLFFSDSNHDEKEFETILSSIGKEVSPTMDANNGILNQLIIVVPDNQVYDSYSSKPLSREARKRFSDSTENQNEIFLLYNCKGEFRTASQTKLDSNVEKSLIEEVKVYGLFEIFENGHGILDSGPGHHYVLQNGNHSDKFIRTANVLNDSNQIDFIALYLLQYIDDETMVFYSLFGEEEHYIDFSQFTLRGHYADEQNLMNYPLLDEYFKAMIWLGRTEIQLLPPAETFQRDPSTARGCMFAAFLEEATSSTPAIGYYSEINELLNFLVGTQDNVTINNLTYLLENANITSPPSVRFTALDVAVIINITAGI